MAYQLNEDGSFMLNEDGSKIVLDEGRIRYFGNRCIIFITYGIGKTVSL